MRVHFEHSPTLWREHSKSAPQRQDFSQPREPMLINVRELINAEADHMSDPSLRREYRLQVVCLTAKGYETGHYPHSLAASL